MCQWLKVILQLRLQELKAFPASIVTDAVTDDPWTVAVGEQLFKRDYVRVWNNKEIMSQ